MAEQISSNESLKDMLECCICAEEYNDPRMLPCIHTFCLNCLEQTGRDLQPGQMMSCPLCRAEFPIPKLGFIGIPKNFFMEQLLNMRHESKPETTTSLCDACRENLDDGVDEVPPAKLVCVQCSQKLCDVCCQWHKRTRATKLHELIGLANTGKMEKTAKPSPCDCRRGNPIEMHCKECCMAMCMMCSTRDHRGHECSDVNEVGEELRFQLEAHVAKLSKCNQVELSHIEKVKQNILDKVSNIEADVLIRAATLKEILDKRTSELVLELNTIKSGKMKTLDNHTEERRRCLTMFDSFAKFAKKLKDKGSAVDICRNFKEIKARANAIEQNFSSGWNRYFREDPCCLETTSHFKQSMKYLDHAICEMNLDDINLEKKIVLNRDEYPVVGVAGFDDRIYTVCYISVEVRVFLNQEPFNKIKVIEIQRMTHPRDMVASKVRRSIFVSDWAGECLWEIHVDSEQVIRHEIEGEPGHLSITSSDEMLVMVKKYKERPNCWGCWHLDSFLSPEVKVTESVRMPSEFVHAYYVTNAVQTSNGNFIMAYRNWEPYWDPAEDSTICELANDKQKILRTFKLYVEYEADCESFIMHLSTDDNDHIFLADGNRKVFLLNFQQNNNYCRMILNSDQHRIKSPQCLCYMKNRNQLVVCDWDGKNGSVLILNIRL